jgi:histidine ammonia-lyase
MDEVLLDEPLRWPQVAALAAGGRLELAASARGRIAHSRVLVEAIVDRGVRCYGVNTGVGALCDVTVDRAQQQQLSHNIIMSHACGVGDPLPVPATRAIMACAINNYAHGYSGIRPVVVERLIELLNAGLIPVVPRAGSIGYLSHMAHIALVLIGAGAVSVDGRTIAGAVALQRLGSGPLQLEAKEGLSLVNGTPCASGLACMAVDSAQRLIGWADVVAAMSFENLGHEPGAWSAESLQFRRSEGLATTGLRLTALIAGSEILRRAAPRTQDAMSLRAVPHIHGAARDQLDSIGAVVDRELASVTDNPIVAGTEAAPRVYSGAHAVGTALALAMDGLSIAAAKIAATSERRIDRLVNPLLSGLPAFLTRSAGVSTGLMIAQYTALSLAAENRRLAAPASLDGGVSSGLQEDEVPHATPAALKALAVINNLETMLAIELVSAAQAYEFQDPVLARAPLLDAVFQRLRRQVPTYMDDRPLAADINAAVAFIRSAPPPA